MKTWKNLREELDFDDEEEVLISMEKEIIAAMVRVREENHLSQAQLAELCDVKQPMIARMESGKHSPQLDSILKVLLPLGYTLQIVPRQ